MMYPHPYPLHILILNILDILKKRIIVCFLPVHDLSEMLIQYKNFIRLTGIFLETYFGPPLPTPCQKCAKLNIAIQSYICARTEQQRTLARGKRKYIMRFVIRYFFLEKKVSNFKTSLYAFAFHGLTCLNYIEFTTI